MPNSTRQGAADQGALTSLRAKCFEVKFRCARIHKTLPMTTLVSNGSVAENGPIKDSVYEHLIDEAVTRGTVPLANSFPPSPQTPDQMSRVHRVHCTFEPPRSCLVAQGATNRHAPRRRTDFGAAWQIAVPCAVSWVVSPLLRSKTNSAVASWVCNVISFWEQDHAPTLKGSTI